MSIDRFKQKLKTVIYAINKKKQEGASYEEQKIGNIQKRLQRPKIKEGKYDYPFIDSDDDPNYEESTKKEVQGSIIL